MVVAILLEFALFYPNIIFKIPQKKTESNMVNGILFGFVIFSTAFGLDYFVKRRNPFAYIPGASNIPIV